MFSAEYFGPQRFATGVSGHLKPATEEHFKTSHFEKMPEGVITGLISRRSLLGDVQPPQYGQNQLNTDTCAAGWSQRRIARELTLIAGRSGTISRRARRIQTPPK
jgi:hypothetical protein